MRFIRSLKTDTQWLGTRNPIIRCAKKQLITNMRKGRYVKAAFASKGLTIFLACLAFIAILITMIVMELDKQGYIRLAGSLLLTPATCFVTVYYESKYLKNFVRR